VISVDTAVAHIAGALGTPVWVMLPAAGDFRWLKGREDSPWYPTARLFTQRQLGEWDELVDRVATALRNAVQARNRGALGDGAQLRRGGGATSRSVSHSGEKQRLSPLLSRVAATRFGMVQYLPEEKMLALSLDRYGEWLQPQLDLLNRLLQPGAIVIEANSGIGIHAVALAQALGPSGHVLAYEEHQIFLRILNQNLRMNGIGHLVTVMGKGLTSRKQPQRYREDYDPRVAVSSQEPNCSDTIDELLLDRLDLIKVNDRGTTRDILEGGEDTIWRLRPLLFVAVPGTEELSAIADCIKSFSYRCWHFAAPFFSLANYNRHSDDIFGGLAAHAVIAVPEEVTPDPSVDGCSEIR
jgi:hypothetical protein